MDCVKSFLWMAFGVSALVMALSLFAPDVLSQGRFVNGIPISFPERISYPATGVSGFPPCNSRSNGKVFLFEGSIFSSAECDSSDWVHRAYGLNVIPFIPANFSSLNSGPETAALVDGGWQLSAPALAGSNIRGREIPYPAAPFTMVVGMTADIVAADFHETGMYVRDSATGRIETFAQNNNSAVSPSNSEIIHVVTYTGPTAGGVGVVNVPTGGFAKPVWLFYTDNGAGTYTWSFNYVGPLPNSTSATIHPVLSRAVGTFVSAPSNIGIHLNVANASCPMSTTYFHCSINGNPCQ